MSFNIGFLRRHSWAGMEFMDFQNQSFFDELRDYFVTVVRDGKVKELGHPLESIIEKYTGFRNIELNLVEYGNLCIDAGYINPHNLFNIDNIEYYLPKNEATLYKWYNTVKGNLMKGTIDYTTGKVGGDYAMLPFRIFVNRNVDSYANEKFLKKHDADFAGFLAGTLVHELGHAFGGIMMVHETVSANFHVRSAIHFLANAKNKEASIAVIKDFNRLTETEFGDLKAVEEVIASGDKTAFAVCLSKMIAQRDINNAAGLGVRQMNSEVIADAYSIRMGCDRDLAAGIGALRKSDINMRWIYIPVSAAFTTIWFLVAVGGNAFFTVPALLIVFLFSCGFSALTFFIGDLVPGNYNTYYRRVRNILQEQIQRIKESKHLSNAEKSKMLTQALQSLKISEEIKPFFEGTALQRFFGWMTTGGKFKYIDLEFYTQELISNPVNLLGQSFRNLNGV